MRACVLKPNMMKDKCDREVFLNTFDQIPDYIITHTDKCLLLYLQSGSTGCYS